MFRPDGYKVVGVWSIFEYSECSSLLESNFVSSVRSIFLIVSNSSFSVLCR